MKPEQEKIASEIIKKLVDKTSTSGIQPNVRITAYDCVRFEEQGVTNMVCTGGSSVYDCSGTTKSVIGTVTGTVTCANFMQLNGPDRSTISSNVTLTGFTYIGRIYGIGTGSKTITAAVLDADPEKTAICGLSMISRYN